MLFGKRVRVRVRIRSWCLPGLTLIHIVFDAYLYLLHSFGSICGDKLFSVIFIT